MMCGRVSISVDIHSMGWVLSNMGWQRSRNQGALCAADTLWLVKTMSTGEQRLSRELLLLLEKGSCCNVGGIKKKGCKVLVLEVTL